jgi:hypothetical protein
MANAIVLLVYASSWGETEAIIWLHKVMLEWDKKESSKS